LACILTALLVLIAIILQGDSNTHKKDHKKCHKAFIGEQRIGVCQSLPSTEDNYVTMNNLLERKQQQLQYIETELKILDKKTHKFKVEISTTSGNEKITLEQKLEDEILPKLHQLEQEYAGLLTELSDEQILKQLEPEAQPLVGELIHDVEKFQQQISPSPELTQALQQILAELQMVNTSATAKLKVTLPLIPLLASYDLTLDTEAFFTRLRRKIQSLFHKGIDSNP